MSGLRPAPGRLERLNVDVGYDIVVDAAHNGSGLEATLLHLRGETQGRLLALIASVGTADRNRWESIGEAASVLADLVVVGDESPYRRDPAEIRAGLISGCPDAAEVPDRAEAVQWLVDRAEPGDTVLLAGRADEDFRVISTGREPYPTDAELVARALAQQSRS
jgi:UDP-N-acetylmuramoyl-L-alanyl-D-glutamate--2,6-diaminopimelate ligase